MRPDRRVRHSIACGLFAAAVGLTVSASGERAGGAEVESSFMVTARADAFSIEVVDASAPVVPGGQVFFASPASSQATIDSIGASTGFASAPYPGDTAVTGPGAIAAVSGLPLPAYPFYVTSTYPSVPSSSQTSGPFQTESTSSPTETVARARVQFTPDDATAAAFASRATSSASRQSGTGALVAEAETLIQGFSIGPDLAIGNISGRARLSVTPGSEPTRETSFSVGSIRLAGTTVGLTDKGFEPVGLLPHPAPLDELEAVGITLRYLPAEETDTRVHSAGLAVSVVHDVPSQGPTGFTVIFGRVTVAIATGTAGALPDGLSDVPVGIDDSGLGSPGAPGMGPRADDAPDGPTQDGTLLSPSPRGLPIDTAASPTGLPTDGNPAGPPAGQSGAGAATVPGAYSEQAVGARAGGPLVANLGYGPYLALAIGSLVLALSAALFGTGLRAVLLPGAADPVLQLPPRPRHAPAGPDPNTLS